MDRMTWRRYAMAGLLVLAVYSLVPSGVARNLIYVAVGLSAVAAILLGVRIHAPARRRPWILMAAGQALWVIGDALNSWHVGVRHSARFLPTLTDVFYLSAYPVLIVGLALLVRVCGLGRSAAAHLDGATLIAGAGVLGWTLLAGPTIRTAGHSLSSAVIGVAYPLGDVLLAGLLITLATSLRGGTPALRLLFGAVGLLVVGDVVSAAFDVYGSTGTTELDLVWLAAYVAWGAAALHPSMYALSEPQPAGEPKFTRTRYAWLIAATVAAPASLLVQYVTGSHLDLWAVIIGSVVSFLLVVARMNVALEQVVAARRRRLQLQGDLSHQSSHDELTGLSNRTQMLPIIEAAQHRARRHKGILGVIVINLDDFKPINDNLGHRVGDEVLRIVANRIQAAVRLGDIVGRLGGDEFVVLLERIDNETSAVEIAERLVISTAVPITLSGRRDIRVGASVGIAINPADTTDVEALLHDANTALRQAKAAGGGRAEVHGEELRRQIAERAQLETALGRALVGDEFVLDYQPVINVVTGATEGYEALVRWDRPGVGLVFPGQFLPTAELSDLIDDLDTWVLHAATEQLAAWNESTRSRHLTMAVNISGRHICHPRVVADVVSALRESGVAARQLVLEITESAFVDHAQAVIQLEALRRLGVSISLDDFGAAFGKISRLQKLPVDIIKIDRRFLDTTGPTADKLLNLMVQTAHAYGLPVVAEGVEYDHQMSMLRALECESAQGFHLARPMTPQDVERHLSGVWHSNYH